MNGLNEHRETRDAYVGELFRHGNYRVAVCKDGIQWLFQRRRPSFRAGGAAWDTIGYFTTRNALIRLYRAKTGAVADELHDLPERIMGAS